MVLKKIKRELFYFPTCFDIITDDVGKVGDKIKVNFKSYPSGLQIAEYRKFARKDGSTVVEYDYATMMIVHVSSIENLSIGEDHIKDPVTLCDYNDSRLYDLIVEIKNKLFKESEDLEEKES